MSRELENPFTRYFQTRRVVTEEGERFIEWKPPRYGVVPERLYVVTDADVDRPDLIAFKTLGDVRQWWLIMHYNKITDPMSLQTGDKLRIPLYNLPVIVSAAEVLGPEPPIPVPRLRCIPLPPFQTGEAEETLPEPGLNIILTFGFPVPPCLGGMGHFQVQASLEPDFSNIVLSKFTQADTTRWYYWNPSGNNGAGAFEAFPSAGLDLNLLSGQTVYHDIIEGELEVENQYYFRYRVWYNRPGVGWTETEWYAPPAINLPQNP